MSPSSDPHMVQTHLHLLAALGPSPSHSAGWIHLGHNEQVYLLVRVLELEAVPYCPQGKSPLEGELPAFFPALTLSQAIYVPWPSRGDLIFWESRNLRGLRKNWRSSAGLGK